MLLNVLVAQRDERPSDFPMNLHIQMRLLPQRARLGEVPERPIAVEQVQALDDPSRPAPRNLSLLYVVVKGVSMPSPLNRALDVDAVFPAKGRLNFSTMRITSA
jgi:hypothetical protein